METPSADLPHSKVSAPSAITRLMELGVPPYLINATVLGVLAVGVLRNGLNLMGVPSSLQVVSIGLLVIIALLLDSARSHA